ncbi:ABC transporter substrate-binding protein [Phreatobacter stygius]|uniref:ABC transporter substrate-binding protein n=1 Tax=Phreatobacter stygius TaxID=1940610 RepID=A0A4D7AR71_9HYPH|nr:ABC transporter substrate-binding protein [Phreatobacter stygius]QCI63834.1 ABC transporter substrate-binding protein [Phreatobacter stygius]
MLTFAKRAFGSTAVAVLLAFTPAAVGAQPAPAPTTTLTAVLEAEIATLDPHFTSAYITRTFGYAVFDTLFAMDSKGEIKPQMVQDYTVSEDRLTWTFNLREGLAWHDGTPVTAADCVASIRRWGPKAALGRLLTAATASIDATGPRTFVIKLKEPFGLVLDALGRPNAPVPFMLPERLARTPGEQRIPEVIGSGPFKFRPDLHRPGDVLVVERNAQYAPRAEPADFLAGGKVPRVGRVAFRTMPDGSTATSALQTGEIDFLQYVPFDLLPMLERNRRVTVVPFDGMQSFQGYFRINSANKPFDDPEIRRVLWRLIDQTSVLNGLGLPDRYMRPGCRSFFMCGTPYETTVGGEMGENPSVEAAREALKRTKYAGEPIIVLQATDIDAPRVSSAVVADLLRRAGFNVELQAMDWGTVLARRAKRDGWHMFGVHASGFDLASPRTHFYVSNNCIDYAGWHCDPRLTELLAAFAKAPTEPERKRLAGEISKVAYEIVPAVMWGQLAQPAAHRNELVNIVPSAIPVFWNVEKRTN